jgi:hypothetical protein
MCLTAAGHETDLPLHKHATDTAGGAAGGALSKLVR